MATREEKIKRKAVGYGLVVRDTMIMHGAKRSASETISQIVQIVYLAGAAEADANPIKLWKPAEGSDLPIFDREVIVLTQPYPLFIINIDKMVDEFAHTEVKGYGIPSMIEVDAYRKGVNDTLCRLKY